MFSIGMGSSKGGRIGQMAHHSLRNVPSLPTTHLFTSSTLESKLVPFGITPICVSTANRPKQYTYRISATQFCDGLKGPLIVYDPHDPHAHLYDVDDGKLVG